MNMISSLMFNFKINIQEAVMKDTLEKVTEPNLNLKGYLQHAYAHPIFKASMEDGEEEEEITSAQWETDSVPVPTKRQSRRNTPLPSKASSKGHQDLPEP